MASMPVLVFAALVFSMLPDADSALGVAMHDFGRYHNNISHSLVAGVVVALASGVVARLSTVGKFTPWFLLSLVCYELHVIMDFFTVGRGVMVLWPLVPDRIEPPAKLFYGLHWSEGWVSVRHLWTLLTELLFVGMLFAVLWLARRMRSPAGPSPGTDFRQSS